MTSEVMTLTSQSISFINPTGGSCLDTDALKQPMYLIYLDIRYILAAGVVSSSVSPFNLTRNVYLVYEGSFSLNYARSNPTLTLMNFLKGCFL